jgi:hypothetical protein
MKAGFNTVQPTKVGILPPKMVVEWDYNVTSSTWTISDLAYFDQFDGLWASDFGIFWNTPTPNTFGRICNDDPTSFSAKLKPPTSWIGMIGGTTKLWFVVCSGFSWPLEVSIFQTLVALQSCGTERHREEAVQRWAGNPWAPLQGWADGTREHIVVTSRRWTLIVSVYMHTHIYIYIYHFIHIYIIIVVISVVHSWSVYIYIFI